MSSLKEYLESLPQAGDKVDIPERIVCAANKYGSLVIAGVRHGCDAMCDSLDARMSYESIKRQVNAWDAEHQSMCHDGNPSDVLGVLCKNIINGCDQFIPEFDHLEEIQGFLTSKYRFVDRYEAWAIALNNRQIVRRCHGDNVQGGKLFSENLY